MTLIKISVPKKIISVDFKMLLQLYFTLVSLTKEMWRLTIFLASIGERHYRSDVVKVCKVI